MQPAPGRSSGRCRSDVRLCLAVVITLFVHDCSALPSPAGSTKLDAFRRPSYHLDSRCTPSAHATRMERGVLLQRMRGGHAANLSEALEANASEKSQVDGILVSFCEPEPEPVKKMKLADKVWCGVLSGLVVGSVLLRNRGSKSMAWIEQALDPLMRDEKKLDAYLAVGITALFGAGSLVCRHNFADPLLQVKKRAWIISVIASGFCFVGGILSLSATPLEWDVRIRTEMLMETNLSRFLVHFFRAQALLDLVLGCIFYRNELHVMTSVVHHTAYTLLCNWMLQVHASLLFSVCLLEELPTLIMSCGRLNKHLRSDAAFGATYFLFRVLLHTVLAAGIFLWESTDPRLRVIKFNFVLTWCLHAHWFYAWISQQRRLLSQQRLRETQRATRSRHSLASYGWGSP